MMPNKNPTTPASPDGGNICMNAALEYLDRGFSVVPTRQDNKISYVDWKEFQTRHATREEVEAWWVKWPDANVAIITGRISGVFVVDADGKIGISYMTDNLPKTSVYASSGKGLHAYYLVPRHYMVGNRVRLATEVDIRGEGGYIIAPPSVHANGTTYKWIFTPGLDGWDDLAEYKPPTAAMGTKPGSGAGNLNLDLSGVKTSPINQPVPEGQRNNTLAQLAGKWITTGLDDAEIEILARAWNSKNTPPMGEKELLKTISSVRKTHEHNHPALDVSPDIPSSDSREHMFESMPSALLHPGYLLDDILEYLEKMCPISIPVFNLGCALTFLGAIGGQKICGPTGVRTNLYSLLLGHSGSGKDGAPRMLQAILKDIPELDHYCGRGKLTGGAALISNISETPGQHSKLYFFDEFAKILKRERAQHGSAETIGATLLELYSGKAEGKGYADSAKDKKFTWQHVAMIGSATPDDLWDQITPTDLKDGFIARLQVFESRHKPQLAPYEMPLYHENKPKNIIKQLLLISEIPFLLDPDCTGNAEQKLCPKYVPHKLTRTAEALEYLMEWDKGTYQKQCKFSGAWQGNIYNRARETGEKYAAIHHLGKYPKNAPGKPLALDSYEFGLATIDFLNAHMARMASSYVSENEWHGNEQKVIRAIRGNATPDRPGLSIGNLFGKFVRVPERDRKPLIAGLINTGQICTIEWKGARGPGASLLCLAKENSRE